MLREVDCGGFPQANWRGRVSNRLRRGVGAEHGRRRIARQHAHQKEHQHQRPDGGRDQLHQPPANAPQAKLPLRLGEGRGEGASSTSDVCPRTPPSPALRAASPTGRGEQRPPHWNDSRVRSSPQMASTLGMPLSEATFMDRSLTIASGTMYTSLTIFFCKSTYICWRLATSSSL